MKSYIVNKFDAVVKLDAGWDSDQWNSANMVTVDMPLISSVDSGHTPLVQLKMLHDGKKIYGLYRVEDCYVAARATADQQQVCQDSCVEFFVKPADSKYYYNFEFNCGGTLLLYRCGDVRNGDYIEIPAEDMATIERYHTLPSLITEEITEPVTWYLGFAIPLSFFEKYSGTDTAVSGKKWTANFTKCADLTSHPRWLTWMPLSKKDFHLPGEFGELIFE